MVNRYILPAFLWCCATFFSQNIQAQNFQVVINGPTTLCAGDCATLSFTIAPPGAPLLSSQIYWKATGPDGYTFYDTAKSITPCLTVPGTYTYYLVFQTANGIQAQDEHTIIVVPFTPLKIISSNFAPCNFDSSNIGSQCEKVCPNTTVTYSVEFGNPTSGQGINWQVNGAASFVVNAPFNRSVTVTWGAPGTGSVNVTTVGTTDCAGEASQCVTIIAEPEAKFEATPAPSGSVVQVCKGQTVYFKNKSTGADYYEWTFSDDASSSPNSDAQHTYQTPGTHTVTLVARSACLCADTTTLQVEVLDAESPALDCVGTICPGETVTYTASNGCAPFTWTVSPNGNILDGGDPSSDSIKIEWSSGPSGLVTLGALPCSGTACPLPANILVPIISDDAEIRGQDRVCPGAEEEYSIDPFGGTNFVWKLSGGGTIQGGQGTSRVSIDWQNAPAPGVTFWLSVEYESCYLGCKGRDSLAVRILSPFVINGAVELCEGTSGSFSARLISNFQNVPSNWTLTAPNGSAAWSGAGSTVNPPFSSGAGIYRLIAKPVDPTQTCSDQADWAVNVPAKPAKPTGISGEKNICPNTTYTYEVAGAAPQNNIVWAIQNGPGAAVAAAGNPLNVTWAANGPYGLVAHQISADGLGCKSDTVLLAVTALTTLNVTGKNLMCENATTPYSIEALQNVDIEWQIVPATAGAIANGQGTNTVEIFWSQPGGHAVQVNVCGQSAIYPVTVLAPPSPMILHPAGLCSGNVGLVQTTASFSGYAWKDASGTVLAATPAPALGPGSYAVQVTDPNGCSGTQEFTIESFPGVNVSLTTADPTGFCNNSRFVTLTALTNADGNLTYQWFRDGTPLGASGSTYSTNQYGQYTVIATNADGCSATGGPIVLFNYCGGGLGGNFPGAGDACPPGTLDIITDLNMRCDSFQFHVQDASGLYVVGSADWTFGISGGTLLGTSTLENPNFVFPNAGKYIVLLKVELTTGAVCYLIDSVQVKAKAQFKFVPDCPGQNTDFEDISTFLPGSGLSSWQWNFGDPASGGNNTATIRTPSHLYGGTGTYSAMLTVTAISGCTSVATEQVVIPIGVPAAFAPPALKCAGNALEFTATPDPSVTDLEWNFGDPATGAANDAIGSPVFHNFNTPATYTVTTTTWNAYGCTAVFSQNITVTPNTFTGNINPNNPPAICEGSSLTLTAPAGAASYLWSYGGITTQGLTIGKEGNYRVTLTDASGCTYAPPAVKVDVNPSPDATIKALIENDLGQVIGTSYPTLTTCFGEDVHLEVFANGANYTYSWSGGGGTQDEVFFTDDRGNLLPVGTHTFSVTVTDGTNGCTAVTAPFVVTVNPVPTGFSILGDGACGGNPTTLTYSGPTPGNWQYIWSNGTLGTSMTTEQAGKYRIRVINEFGCEAQSTEWLIKPGPNVAAIPSGCHARCKPDSLCLPVIPGIVSWQWFQNGVPVPGGTSPGFVAEESGVYWAELTDNQGCKGQSDPLTLSLYDGYGNIAGQVWSDVNKNGVIDGGDTLIPDIAVRLLQNGLSLDTLQSNGTGGFVFSNILSTAYIVQLIEDQLGPNWKVIIGQNGVTLKGCDALGISNLLIQYVCPPRLSSVQLRACPGDAATYNGQQVPTGTSQIFTFKVPDGCDSTVTVTVAPLPISIISLALRTCPGTMISYDGTMLAIGQTKSFVFKSAVSGCDSIVNVSVSALPTSSSTVNLKTCPGTPVVYEGVPLNVGASQSFILKNYLGCDSTVAVTVSALPTSTNAVALKACPGTSATYNGTPLAIGTTQVFVFNNYLGCDSTVTVSVTANPVSINSLALKTCPGTPVVYSGQSLPAGTTQDFVFKNYLGCDSTVTVAVTALPTSSSSVALKACPGQSVTYNNTTLKAGDVKQFLLKNYVQCDSVVTVTVQAAQPTSSLLDVDVCPGETYMYDGKTLPAGTTQDFVFTNAEGCDSTVTVMVTAFPAASFALQAKPSCANTPNGSVTVATPTGGLAPYRYSLDGTQFQDELIFNNLSSGDYTIWLEDSNGCLFEKDTTIATLARLEVALAGGVLSCDSTAVRLAPTIAGDTTGLTYLWSTGATTASASLQNAAEVWLEVKNQCETIRSEVSVSWADLPNGFSPVYVPNVMMPDSREPDNHQFKPFFAAGLTLLDYHLEVFDRWGNLMFRTNQPEAAWDGAFRSDDMEPGVYVWYLRAHLAICGRTIEVMREGDVTVVR